MKKKICVVGLGYVGLPLAHAFAKKKNKVIGFDINQSRISEQRCRPADGRRPSGCARGRHDGHRVGSVSPAASVAWCRSPPRSRSRCARSRAPAG